ncbi:copper resistance protein NlpE N-terminal domain-containing protein [Acinetobacter variabilis]|uniref:copper resistance protein NlpE N-terminal domain-containing protein n=1 Tax=Acinetobacter variabilis TaxID=70346 RepID=UPI001330DDA8|nr:copper resistance protein NlpE N-terminal domain-containing protein [Acinetobacter variabilis]
MKKVILIPLVATGALFGCQDQTQSAKNTIVEAKAQIPAWAGEYQGTTPCMGCLSRCDDCPGMAVMLTLHEDQTYTLERESLSGHNEVQTFSGPIRFQDDSHQKIELVNVATRNLLYVDLEEHVLEIREDKSGKRYQMQSDFILGRFV